MSQSEPINGDQSVYRRIVDQLEELQQLHQKLVRKEESGIYEDPKMSESKQKGVLTSSTQKGLPTTPQ